MTHPAWLTLTRGSAPLVLAFPHTGTLIPGDIAPTLQSQWLARKDTDWHIDQLYAFAHAELDATLIHTSISRTLIDCNRDPDGNSLYPGQATTGLCPTTTFDGEPLYRAGHSPTSEEIERRKHQYFAPYHAAIADELTRLRHTHPNVVLYDAHSIRSVIPRLFDGTLPNLNLGTHTGVSCAPRLQQSLTGIMAASPFENIINGRFKGGWTTRHYGQPQTGIHALQMELACRTYLHEPAIPTEQTWPTPLNEPLANQLRPTLRTLLQACLKFATSSQKEPS